VSTIAAKAAQQQLGLFGDINRALGQIFQPLRLKVFGLTRIGQAAYQSIQ
jgi:hypothetical protein